MARRKSRDVDTIYLHKSGHVGSKREGLCQSTHGAVRHHHGRLRARLWRVGSKVRQCDAAGLTAAYCGPGPIQYSSAARKADAPGRGSQLRRRILARSILCLKTLPYIIYNDCICTLPTQQKKTRNHLHIQKYTMPHTSSTNHSSQLSAFALTP